MADIRRIVRLYRPWSGIANSSGRYTTAGWTVSGTASSPTVAATSSGLRLQGTTSAINQYVQVVSPKITVKPNRNYLFLANVYPAAGPTAHGIVVTIEYYNSSDTLVGNPSSGTITTQSDITVGSAVLAPATAAYVIIRMRHTGTTGTGALTSYYKDMVFEDHLLDLNDGSIFSAVRDTFQVVQGARGSAAAPSGTRFGGADIVSELHENDKVNWQALVAGTTVDHVLYNCEELVRAAEASTNDTYLEWRPDGATKTTYFHIRGPVEFNLTHSAIRLKSGRAEYVDLSFPVAPLAQGASELDAISSTTVPAVIAPAMPMGDSAALGAGAQDPLGVSAQLDVATVWSGAAIPWCLFGWSRTPTTPLSGSLAPFGFFEAESYATYSGAAGTWTSVADGDYRGGNGIRSDTSGAGSAYVTFAVDPSTIQPDDFTRNTVDIEFWARVEIASTVVSPKLTLSLEPFTTTNFGAARYSPEYGSFGKLLVNKPSSGTFFRPVRLGTLTLPCDPSNALRYMVRVAASWAAGSTGTDSFGLDYVVMVPARRRATSRTGVSGGATYPKFVVGTGSTARLIKSDLSGLTASTAATPPADRYGPDIGMGGSVIEPNPGYNSLLVWPSTVVPDDPVASTTEMAKEHSITGSLYMTPRYSLIR